jgi:hypothetical protein
MIARGRRLAVVMDGGGVVGRVQIVEILDAAGDGHQGKRDLTVADEGRGQHEGDRDFGRRDIQM